MFTQVEEYPILQKSMIFKELPKTIIPFETISRYKGNRKGVYVCTYERDKIFECIRRNPLKYIGLFKQFGGVIGLDFNIHSDMPIVKQKSQMYDNLSLTYFYAKQGIKIIPNIRCGEDELNSEFLKAIPKKELIAIGTHGFIKEKHQKSNWYCSIETIINNLKPDGIIVYGKP